MIKLINGRAITNDVMKTPVVNFIRASFFLPRVKSFISTVQIF